jgi:hypothetical protein
VSNGNVPVYEKNPFLLGIKLSKEKLPSEYVTDSPSFGVRRAASVITDANWVDPLSVFPPTLMGIDTIKFLPGPLCNINISPSALTPLYVCNEGWYIRIVWTSYLLSLYLTGLDFPE